MSARSAIGAVMLGLGRALGETMAVTFIIGNSHGLPKSLFDSGSTIASTIANEFTEATSAMHTSALIALGLGAVPHHLRRAGDRPRRCSAAAQSARTGRCSTDARRRRVANGLFVGFCRLCGRAGRPVALAAILWSLLSQGIGRPEPRRLHHVTPAPGSPGGLRNAIVGSIMMCALAMVIAVAVGILAGTWLAEYGRQPTPLRQRRPLPERRAAVGAVDPGRPVRL